MPLHPVDTNSWNAKRTGVRVYLDDIEAVATILSANTPATMILQEVDAPDSTFDKVEDLMGRTGFFGIEVRSNDGNVMFRRRIGVTAQIVKQQGRQREEVEHFLNSLDRVRHPLLFRARNLGERVDVDVVLNRRAAAAAQRSQRLHDLVVALVSGAAGVVVGYIIGAVVGWF